jgi:hypothetical protein
MYLQFVIDEFFEHRQDIGRHNALDKLYGFCLERRIPVRNKAPVCLNNVLAVCNPVIILSTCLGVKVIFDIEVLAIALQIDDSKGFAHVELTKDLGDRFEYSTKRMIASCLLAVCNPVIILSTCLGVKVIFDIEVLAIAASL